jgi:hypothetical protein
MTALCNAAVIEIVRRFASIHLGPHGEARPLAAQPKAQPQ